MSFLSKSDLTSRPLENVVRKAIPFGTASALFVGALILSAYRPVSVYVDPVFTVDDDGPADFSDLQTAIDSVPQKSVLKIAAGTYSSFVISGKRVTLVGNPEAKIMAGSVIRDLGFAARVALHDLSLASLDILNCQATVFVSDVSIGETHFALPPNRTSFVICSGCTDVRIHSSSLGVHPSATSISGLLASNSRVELVSCQISGSDGKTIDLDSLEEPGSGGAAVSGRNASRLHVVRTSLFGGDAGNSEGSAGSGGTSGPGLTLTGASTAVVVGGSLSIIQGGLGGFSEFGVDSRGGNGIELLPGFEPNTLRISNATSLGGEAGPGALDGSSIYLGFKGTGGTTFEPSIADPSLELLGDAMVGGGIVTFRVHGEPGSITELALGRTTPVIPTAGIEIEQLLVPVRNFSLGAMPASGFVDVPFVPGGFPAGTFVAGQATLSNGSGNTTRTNSAAFVVACADSVQLAGEKQ